MKKTCVSLSPGIIKLLVKKELAKRKAGGVNTSPVFSFQEVLKTLSELPIKDWSNPEAVNPLKTAIASLETERVIARIPDIKALTSKLVTIGQSKELNLKSKVFTIEELNNIDTNGEESAFNTQEHGTDFKTNEDREVTAWSNQFFGNAILLQNKTVRAFSSKRVIIPALLGEGDTLPESENYNSKRGVNRNIKDARVKLLQNLAIYTKTLSKEEYDHIMNLTSSDDTLLTEAYNYLKANELEILAKVKEAVTVINEIPLTPNLLEKISLNYKNLDADSKLSVDAYLDYVQYLSFDFLISIQGKDIISLNDNAFYDIDSIKYDYERTDKKSAKIWNTKDVTDHAETQASAVKLLLNNTPLLSYNTYKPLEDQYLNDFMASKAWMSARQYYNSTDPNGVLKAITAALNDKKLSIEDKNVLYTLYQTYFNKENPVSLAAKSKINNGDLINVLINNFRTQVEMNFSEVQEKGKGNFTLVSLNAQTSGSAIFQVRSKLVSSFDVMVNQEMSEIDKIEEDDLKNINVKSLVSEINRLLGDSYGLNAEGILGKSEADIMIETYPIESLKSFYRNLYDLRNEIFETKLLLELSPNSQTKDSIVKVSNGAYNVNLSINDPKFAAIVNILAELRAQSEGVRKKVTIRNSHDTTNSSIGNSNLINQLKDQFNRIRRSTNAINNNFKLFEKNPLINDKNAFLGILFRGDIVASGSNPVLNAKASVAESTTYNILNFYAEQLANNEDPYFDFTNFSDKTLNGAIRINKKYFIKTGSLKQSPRDILNAKKANFVEMQRDYLNKSAIRILSNYQILLDTLADLKLIEKQTIEITDDLGQSLINLNDKLGKIFHKEAKFNYKGKNLKFDEVLNLAASISGVTIINYVDYNDEIIKIKDTLIKDLIIFNDADKVTALLDSQLLDFKNGLNLNKVNLTASSAMVDTIKKAATKIFGDDTLAFPTVSNKGVVSGKIPAEFIEAYFYDWLLASNSTMNATAGHSINQKAGYLVETLTTEQLTEFNKKGINSTFSSELQNHLKNLSTLWQAQTKRNVIFTASMLNYNINTDRGLKGGANVSFVRDLETTLKPIGVGVQKVTDWDGASIGLMHHMIRLYRSLGGKFSSDGGIDQKSFINFLDPLSGSSTLIKHALFAMTPGVVKASLGNDMNILNLYENVYKKHSVSGINLLNNITDTESTLKNPVNLYYYDELTGDNTQGAIYQIQSWDYVEIDQYEITELNLTTGQSRVRPVEIKNMWDLIVAFKGFNTLIPSQSKTNYSTLDVQASDTKYFKPSFGAFELLVDLEDSNVNSGLYQKFDFLNTGQLATEIITESIDTGLIFDPNHEEKMKLGFNKFIESVNGGDPTILLETLKNINSLSNDSDILYFADQVLQQEDSLITRSYQPLKGVMTDMITTYGGAKVGQNNMNSLQTLLGLEQDPNLQIPGVNTLYHKLINYENGGLQVDTAHDPHHAELSIPKQMLAALNFGMLEGERAQELNQIFGSLVLESIKEDLDLSDYLASYTSVIDAVINRIIKNPNVSLWFNETLQKPTPQNIVHLANLFNEGVKDINSKISPKELSSIIDTFKQKEIDEFDLQEFEKAAKLVITANRIDETIANNVAKKFTDLLTSSEDLENASMSDLILEAFKDNLPVDHSALLKDAVSALAASFSNKAARLKFDGLLAVIQPASKMIQVVELKGTPEGLTLYSRNGNNISTRILKEGETATLIGEQVEIQARYSKVDPNTLFNQKRELKGPELLGTLLNTKTGEKTQFIGSVLDVDYDEQGNIKGDNSQLNTSLAIDGLEEVVKGYLNGKYVVPTDKNTLGLLNYWANELGLNPITTPAALKKLIKTIQVKEFGLVINKGETYEQAVENFNKNGDNIQVRTQRAFGDRAKKSINDDIEGIMQKGIPTISAFINPDFWADYEVHDLKVTPGEIVAPMLFAEQFLLQEGDDFNNISEEFFHKRLMERHYVEGNYKKVLISNSADPVLLYTDKDAFDFETRNLPQLPLNEEGTHLVDSTGKLIMEIPVGVNPKIYRRTDNSLVIHITGLNKSGKKTNSYEIMANLKGLLNKTFKSGYKLKSHATRNEVSEKFKLEASKMWEAFKLFNEVTGARIPGQHYQSFQFLKIVGWINDKQSAVWVPRATTLFAGSDW